MGTTQRYLKDLLHRYTHFLGIPVFTLLCFLFVQPVFAIPESHDRDLADAYVQTFLNVRHSSRDSSLLKTALEFYPRHGDALYLLGKHPGIPKKKAVGYLEQAITSEYWSEYSQEKAGIELFKLYYQLKRYAAAGVLLSGYSFNFFTNPEDALLLTDYYRQINDNEDYLKALDKGYSLWYEIFVGLKIKADEDFRNLLLTRVQEFPDFNPGIQALEELYNFPGMDSSVYKQLLSRYISSGGFSPSLHGHAVVAGLLDRSEMAPVLPYGNIVQELSSMPDALAILQDEYKTYSGDVGYDWNNDGFYEETLRFGDGMVMNHTLDNDQDGLPEIEIQFASSDMVAMAHYNYKSNTINIKYTDYPFIDSIVSEFPDISYTFGQTRYPVLEMNDVYFLPDEIISIKEEVLLSFAGETSISQISSGIEYSSTGNESEYMMDLNGNGIPEYGMSIEEGKTVQFWDTDEDGTADIIQKHEGNTKTLQIFDYTITLSNGVPVELKVDGSVRELNVRGRMVWINTQPFAGITAMDPRGYFRHNGKNYYAYHYEGYLFIQPVGMKDE